MPLANSFYYQLFKYDGFKINWFHIFFSQKEICGHNKEKVFENPVYTNVYLKHEQYNIFNEYSVSHVVFNNVLKKLSFMECCQVLLMCFAIKISQD